MDFRKELRAGDREAIIRVLESSKLFFQAEIDIGLELFDDAVQRGFTASGYYFAFIEKQGEVLGYTCYGPIGLTLGSFDIYWIAVQHNFRGQGLGQKLLAYTEELITAQAGRKLYLETSSRDEYTPTRAFYIKCGYTLEASIRDFYAPGDAKCIFSKGIA